MAGEYQLAQKTFDDLIKTANADSSMSEDSLLRAMLATSIELCAKTRPVADIHHEINYLLENLSNDDEFVITRGC